MAGPQQASNWRGSSETRFLTNFRLGRYLGEVVSMRSPVELLDPASPGSLIRSARGIQVPGGVQVAGQLGRVSGPRAAA